MILGSKRFGGGVGYFSGSRYTGVFLGWDQTQEKRSRMSLRSLTPFVRFIFLLLFPDGLWTTDELDEMGVAGGRPVESLEEKLSKLPGALSDLT